MQSERDITFYQWVFHRNLTNLVDLLGDKIYTTETSMIGGVGIQQTFCDVQPLVNEMGIEDRFFKNKE